MKLHGRREKDETRTFQKMGEALGFKSDEGKDKGHLGNPTNVSLKEKK